MILGEKKHLFDGDGEGGHIADMQVPSLLRLAALEEWAAQTPGTKKCVYEMAGCAFLRRSELFGIKVSPEDSEAGVGFMRPLLSRPEELDRLMRQLCSNEDGVIHPDDLGRAETARFVLSKGKELPFPSRTLLAAFIRATKLDQTFFTTSDVTSVLEGVKSEAGQVSTTLNQMAKARSPCIEKASEEDASESKTFEITDLGYAKIEDLISHP